ncbi:hypothetical protein ZYGR_0AD03140 [Zygosaccharomyces rouxii]|uniref:ZYRO0G13288p n=2 Tax=Zygosaccharomyces rouxii TaxID=4956 RepID=C5E0J6_ZYGRC|nr:uncharacterized protein ZYRO0G13288g [Zygosaccharomyces rouxii]KAH9202624.1 hypothetical protein LQ764DRAFT_35823 [Zygosaccharomyces rouxii]GAV51131.1 hypothetical protein ZYGR_0AD03140 [Zygosaccharomyces rouxii]CAR29630.1 ZYRO0G13288p [Zygosaccharomyces rouxii]
MDKAPDASFENLPSSSHEEPLPEYQGSLQRFSQDYLKPNLGLVYLIAAQLFNSLMVVSTKVLETDKTIDPNTGDPLKPIKPLQILLSRMSITYAGALLYMLINRRSIPDAPFGAPGLRIWLFLRGAVGFFGVFGLYFSLMYLTVSDAVLITFLTPTVTVVLAALILKERFTRAEAVGTLVSLLGVVLIVRPSFLFGQPDDPDNSPAESADPAKRLLATLVGLLGVLGASTVYIVLRYIGDRAHAIISVAYFSLTVTIVSSIGILVIPSMQFSWPHGSRQWFLLINLGVCGFIFQLLLTMGIQRERAGRGSAMSYTQLVYAVIWDVMLWHHWPSMWSWLGMLVIVGATVAVARYKSKEPIPELPLEESMELEDI